MKKLLFVTLMLPVYSHAQTFFVTGKDPKSVDVVQRKISYEGYTLINDSLKAQYIVHLQLDGSFSFGFKRPFAGYIQITGSDGKEVGRTRVRKQHPAALNGYNASYGIFSALAKKDLADELKKTKPL
jgi:hypothetical protein